jgi:hypothetical protein
VISDKRISFLALIVVASVLVSPSAGAQQQELQALRNADFVFIGTVVQTGQASFPEVPPSSGNMVVKVTGIIEKPDSAMLDTGDDVTLRAPDGQALKPGARGVFFASSWIYGKGIALAEQGMQSLPEGSASPETLRSVNERVAQMLTQIDNEDLRQRIKAADAVIAGEVISVQPAPLPAKKFTSEHDPDWQDAIVKVTVIIKGGSDLKTVAVRFPASLDVAWYGAPKLRPDQRSIFILTVARMSDTPAAELNAIKLATFTVLSAKDVIPEDQLKQVQAAAGHE